MKRSLSDESIQERNMYLFSDIIITASTVIGTGYQKLDKLFDLAQTFVIDKPDSCIFL